MGKRPPCVLYQSFLVLFVFVHDAPNKGTHPPVMHLTSLESHHSQELCEAPSSAATAYGSLFVPLQRSACDWTQVSLKYPYQIPYRSARLRCGCAAPSDSKGRVAYRFRRRQKEGKGCAVLFGFQRTGGGYRESPLTFHAEKLRGLQPSFLIF